MTTIEKFSYLIDIIMMDSDYSTTTIEMENHQINIYLRSNINYSSMNLTLDFNKKLTSCVIRNTDKVYNFEGELTIEEVLNLYTKYDVLVNEQYLISDKNHTINLLDTMFRTCGVIRELIKHIIEREMLGAHSFIISKDDYCNIQLQRNELNYTDLRLDFKTRTILFLENNNDGAKKIQDKIPFKALSKALSKLGGL